MCEDSTAVAVSEYAGALEKAESEARGSVASAAAAARREASARLAELDAAASGLRSGQQETSAIAVAEGEQLLDPAALDPVVAAEASAHDAALRHRADQATPHGHILQPASLDPADRAGRALPR